MRSRLIHLGKCFFVSSVLAASGFAQQSAPAAKAQTEEQSKSMSESCPLHAEHMKAASKQPAQTGHGRHAAVNERGDQAMGFSHLKTTHHFRLSADGGAIEVVANDAQDADSLAQIRQHLSEIANQFSAGDFTLPQRIHAQTPPGALKLKELKAQIKYRYEDTESGGRVRITTNNPRAREAMHSFLRFQISDHQTGDSGKIEKF